MERRIEITPRTVKSDRRPMAAPVYVESEGSRSLAYRDEQGVWRYYYGQQRILGAVKPVKYEEAG
jgi:hypothetical protein